MRRLPAMLGAALLLALAGCSDKGAADTGAVSPGGGAADGEDGAADGSDAGEQDGTGDDGSDGDSGDDGDAGPDPFADVVVSFTPGETAGFGAELFPDVVLGAPAGLGDAGSLDVLSLGNEGEIVLGFDDIGIVDGEGPDLIVFENPFTGWYETGRVAVSEDGLVWHEWDCDESDAEGLYPGCAGVGLVWANPDNELDPTDPETAGGDAFDLAELGLARARFVRIRDTGANSYGGTSGGFDLDAVAIVNGEEL